MHFVNDTAKPASLTMAAIADTLYPIRTPQELLECEHLSRRS
jgi:hypothetical protein